tara:strand:+ start:93 stop:215 length:123 start_codon:yes stop_codon:yes gene_type:complete
VKSHFYLPFVLHFVVLGTIINSRRHLFFPVARVLSVEEDN